MKTKIIITIQALTLIAFLTGCGSTKLALKDSSPVAIVSIVGNSQVPWVADDPNNDDEASSDGILSNMVNKLIDGQNPEIVTAKDRLDYADDSFRSIVSEVAACEFIDKNKVVSSERYQNTTASYFNALSATVVATGYKDFTTLGAKNARLIMQEVGANSLIIANFTFEKKLLSGNKWNGEFVGLVTMKVRVLNERGKEIINKTFITQTSERTKISSHKYNKDTFVETLKEAVDSAIRQFAVSYMGEVTEDSAETQTADSTEVTSIPMPARASQPADSQAETTAEVSETADTQNTKE
ncbi:hypothetical protein [Treponema sp.]|uniref:hypothetical protein n=1 Tax=Treponema sp. TaxID=166 RepID=UPI00388D7048